MAYAATTEVPVDKTRMEIEKLLAKHGADRIAVMTSTAGAVIVFEANERRLKFALPLPPPPQKDTETNRRSRDQVIRSKWRALLLCIKAKMEAVESRIETFEEAFLAHVVMPNGQTVYEASATAIETSYKDGKMPDAMLMLEGPRS